VFSELIKHYSKQNDIILDPFCGGGVTVVESLALGRKAIGVDVNPLATYVTRMEILPLETKAFLNAFHKIVKKLLPILTPLYTTVCPRCRTTAEIVWCEWSGANILTKINYRCTFGHKGIKKPQQDDLKLVQNIAKRFQEESKQNKLKYPHHEIPKGDKTNSIINKGYQYFWQLFSERNLLALSYLYKEIMKVKDENIRDFLYFAFSASLKWASRQCHLRGDVVDGWAMHAYWVYPRQLEINVWHTFAKRVQAILRGKNYLQSRGFQAIEAKTYQSLRNQANFLLLTRSADKLPIPDNSVDCIITDPPYGDNVNYGELSDFWTIWHPELQTTIDKKKEAVINKTQSKDIGCYEDLLSQVFQECNRVLKPEGSLVATFNSKDLKIVSTFLRAVAQGGFVLANGGLHYQEPIKAYTTTVHAKEVGAFTGDFIFTFRKTKRAVRNKPIEDETWKLAIDKAIGEHARCSRTEIEFRRGVYERVLPLFAQWAFSANGQLIEMASYAEQQIRKQEFAHLPFEKVRAIAR